MKRRSTGYIYVYWYSFPLLYIENKRNFDGTVERERYKINFQVMTTMKFKTTFH